MNNPPLTAAQRLLADPQYILTTEYWRDTLIDYAKNLPGLQYVVPDTGYENSKDCHIAPAVDRPLADIASTIGRELLEKLTKLAAQSPNGARLTFYRTMEGKECNAIMDWFDSLKTKTESFVKNVAKKPRNVSDIRDQLAAGEFGIIPINGHAGDKAQATRYLGSSNVLVGLVLKPEAHRLLFTPAYMALTRQGKPSAYIAECERLRQLVAGVTNREKFVEAQQSEGAKKGYIGLKPEVNGKGFSLQIGSDASKLLFQLFVDDIVEAEADAPAPVPPRGKGFKAARRLARRQ